ncbi:AAA family ATPase [Cerasicoccus arenae]|uniref:ATPase AAA n=1 Tax=Cerasicoccus arenae TaxID=424488 RepID=A0A8J3DC25_9BACT|nr:MoxR family ATPase [Cerasicoccus arenae]MBK1859954.1 MoxR family ATPase [Cerasicoccus arenae]GHC01457.1 ATPase AAA [Cerasicoccus arenae]
MARHSDEIGSENEPVWEETEEVQYEEPAAIDEAAYAEAAMQQATDEDMEALEVLRNGYGAIKQELAKVIVGQEDVIDQVLMAIFTKNHALLVGVPGLAKTLLISTLAQTLHLSFKRVQFTPDLMPSDITGTEIMATNPETGERNFRFMHGPIFANIVLADEINRTPPKTQAALLEAMQERQVTVGGTVHKLPSPFFVLATQNPLDQEGTYTLPEAQLDRFMFLINVDYPDTDEEIEIMKRASSPSSEEVHAILDEETILQLQKTVKRVPVADHVFSYAEKIVRMTRASKDLSIKDDWARKYLGWGAGPRASISLIAAAKAYALLHGNFYVSCDDVAAVALPVMRHRISPNFQAQSEGITSESLIEHILKTVPRA